MIEIIILFVVFLFICCFIWKTIDTTINTHTEETIHYLNGLHRSTPTQIKGELGKSYRYGLIKNLKTMKKVIQLTIVLFLIILICILFVIGLDSRSYFKTMFEIEKNKIELRTEESVDSLLFVIERHQKITDSLIIINSNLNQNISILKENDLKATQYINGQTKVIKKLEKQVKDLDAIIAY